MTTRRPAVQDSRRPADHDAACAWPAATVNDSACPYSSSHSAPGSARNSLTAARRPTPVGAQTLYGVWDWNLSAWNALPGQGANYVSLTTAQFHTANSVSSTSLTLVPANLQAQTLTVTAGLVDSSNTTVTLAQCATSCTAGVFGWRATLVSTNGDTTTGLPSGTGITEQIVAPPSLFEGALIVNSVVPQNPQVLSCLTPNTDTGVLYVINVLTGGTFNFGTTSSPNLESAFVNYHDANLIGQTTSETGATTILTSIQDTIFVLGQLIAPTPTAPGRLDQINLPSNTTATRQTWVELR